MRFKLYSFSIRLVGAGLLYILALLVTAQSVVEAASNPCGSEISEAFISMPHGKRLAAELCAHANLRDDRKHQSSLAVVSEQPYG